MRRAALLLCCLLAACGGEPAAEKQATSQQAAQEPYSDVRAAFDPSGCSLMREWEVEKLASRALGRRVDLRRRGNNSYQLSLCTYRGAGVSIKLTVDSAPEAQRRYWNRIVEQQEFHAADSARRPQLVFGVGNDRTYGGAGAYWVPSVSKLQGYRGGRMVIVALRLPGVPDATKKRVAARLAHAAFKRIRKDIDETRIGDDQARP